MKHEKFRKAEDMSEIKLRRREFMKFAGLWAAAFSAGGFANMVRGACETVSRRPNVLLILTDDQGWGDIRSHGNEIIDTPVMDRLAGEGARFDRFFVSPVCSPTRASLLTGRYHLRTGTHGVTRGYENMRSEEVTIAEALRQGGYVTGCFGKWHNGAHDPYHPNGQGFDEFVGFCGGHWNNYFNTQLERNGTEFSSRGYITNVLTNAAIKFIEKNKERPFFCYVPYNAPHSPFQVPDKYFDKYKGRGLDDELACVYAMCENLDDNIGRILKRLDELELSDNTIVLFTTDNGPNTNRYNGGMKGRKGSENEGGVRVPFFVRWPGHIKAGRTIEEISSHIDLLPTLVELCGVEMPRTLPLDGINLAGLLMGEGAKQPDRMIFTFKFPRRDGVTVPGSVRTQRWRAVMAREGWELYDMKVDPGQKEDVSEKHPRVTKKLGDAYEKAVVDVTRAGFEPLPIHIGYPEWPVVVLPGHEAFLEPSSRKGISYNGRAGWANDWITNWTSTEAYPWWEVEVVKAGSFEVTLRYVCAKENVGAKVRVEGSEGIVRNAHNPEPVPSPDRVKRIEVYEKVWSSLSVGTVRLKKGRTRLAVRAVTKPGEKVMDLKAVQIRRID
ncbi:MAG: arylsulfatase [Planctomycetota bacterium]